MRELKIALGNSRQAKYWSNKTMSFEEICNRLKTPIKTTETSEEYPKLPKGQRDDIKDKGGFVGGHLREGLRKVDYVDCRSLWTPDLDDATPEFVAALHERIHFLCAVYSTHGHTPEAPRLRLVAPFSRDVSPDEFTAISRFLAADIGIGMFDVCSFTPNQLMYWPTCPSNGDYLFDTFEGKPLDPDAILTAHPNWRDCSLLPTTPSESKVSRPSLKQQEDPLSKPGVVGAFCRAYSIEAAIEAFLPDIYKPSVVDGRRDYINGTSCAGLVLYDDKFAYSHHATDPAYGKLLNAFDLVRLHRFPPNYDDPAEEKKSYHAMAGFAVKDETVGALLLREKQEEAAVEFTSTTDWAKALTRDRNGGIQNTLHNLTLILQNDEQLKPICFNQLADGMEIKGEVPWKHPARFWRDADDAQLICYVDANYGSFSARNFDIAVTKVVDDRSYHPIKDFFASLPPWDGVPRVDTLLVDYLGAEDNAYTRAVTRKALCAAVTRIWTPGVKYDYILVLNGPQGIGKSTLICKLGGEWYSDSLNLSDMNDKTAAEKLQGYWILEIGEMAGMRKADIEKVKAFVSRQDDKYRASFGRRVTPHPRQCIFFGTTNSENGYLRDITGNRRFWTVKTPGTGRLKPWQLTAEEVRQIWAEVLTLVDHGEKLYL
ncbi:MAG: virulence-associated E family protein, partial [Synergistaceae bacterium]|nr:virulence-associated E family protein [Synergistaceae bacterium]